MLAIVTVFTALDDGERLEAAPRTNGYALQPILSSGYLDSADSSLIEFAMIPGEPNEAIVASQSGLIYRVALDASFAPAAWGNLSGSLTFNGEQGLMSVAFAPNFETSGRVYAYYTPGSPTPTVLARYSATETDLNEASGVPLLNIEEFASNHNGGHIDFDSDGYLYLSLGDGGGGGDPREKGQALNTLLGKVLRLDVSGPTGYAIPPGNPFSDGPGPIREEIFAYGFRNPWRMSIDPLTDDVWLGDVGQGAWEEVDKVVSGGNYGWDCEEGNHAFSDSDQGYPLLPCGGPFLPARAEYSHSFGQAVTGGVVYRGDDLPELYGWYVYGDFYTGRLWAVDTVGEGAAVLLADLNYNLASFTLLPDGEIAVVTYNDGVHKLVGDYDQDGVLNQSDNCPDWPNAGQGMPSWSVPAGDADCDGYPNTVTVSGRGNEAVIGTNAADQCSNTVGLNDEVVDAWPPDVNDSRTVNLSDLSSFSPWYNVIGPNPPNPAFNPRFDLNANNVVNLSDLSLMGPFYNKSCTP